jgi:excisionase family DNA binding protein
MEIDELKKLIKELISEVLDEKVINKNLVTLNIAYETLLNKFYKKPYIYELVMKNKIPHHKIGKHTYFSIIELEEWLQKTKPKV